MAVATAARGGELVKRIVQIYLSARLTRQRWIRLGWVDWMNRTGRAQVPENCSCSDAIAAVSETHPEPNQVEEYHILEEVSVYLKPEKTGK